MKHKKIGFWGFMLPTLLTFTLTVIVPTLTGFYYSFTDWNGIGNSPKWIGVQNYIKIFSSDSDFLRSFIYTLFFVATAVIIVNLLAFILALVVTQKFAGANFLRSIFFMPNLIGGVLVGFSWQFIFTQVFNYVGNKWNIPWLQNWLSTTTTSTIGLLIVVAWQLSGYMMLIYIAQLQNIPDNLKEAAQIDGASSWQVFKNVILPLMAPAFTIGLFLTLSSSFKLFDQNLTLTNGGPAGTTEMLALNIYRTAFTQNQLGVAQSKAVIFFVVVAIVSLTQLYISKKKEVEM